MVSLRDGPKVTGESDGPTSAATEAILSTAKSSVKLRANGSTEIPNSSGKRRGRPSRINKRRQSHGSAWHWKQTDAWYYTLIGTKKRMPLFDEDGQRIRGVENKKAAQLALARVKLAGDWQANGEPPAKPEEWIVAKVCSEYIQYCERGVANGKISKGHHTNTASLLNDLCKFCGALPVAQLKKSHIQIWIDGHTGWKSPASHRHAIAIVLAAFNHGLSNHDVPHGLKGLKKPQAQARLHSLSALDEQVMYEATDEPFRNFLFAALHTGLRPFCELAKLTANDVEELPRGQMWRVYSSKTKKTRKIPVRPEVAELTRRLLESAPIGSGTPLFRNTKGTAWTRVNGVARFIAIRKKLGWNEDSVRKGYSSYSTRHTFAHRMLSGYWNGGVGCSIETLAELIGDTPKVAFDHYGKEWGQHYQDPLWTAIGVNTVATASLPAPTNQNKAPARKRRQAK